MSLEKQIEYGEKTIRLIENKADKEFILKNAILYMMEVNVDTKNGVGYDTRLYNSFVEKYQEYKSRIEKKIEDNYSQEDIQEQLNEKLLK